MNYSVAGVDRYRHFVMAVAGSIGRVILRQNIDSQTLQRVEGEVRDIQARKEVLSDQVGKHEIEIAVMEGSDLQMFNNIMASLAEIRRS